jgi:hypothetical protein
MSKVDFGNYITLTHTLLTGLYLCVRVLRRAVHRSNIFIHTDNWNRFLYPLNHIKQTPYRAACGQKIYVVILLFPLHSYLFLASAMLETLKAHSGSTADTSKLRSSLAVFAVSKLTLRPLYQTFFMVSDSGFVCSAVTYQGIQLLKDRT